MKKRISAALLALVMMLSLLPVSAAAIDNKTGTATVTVYDWDTGEKIPNIDIQLTVWDSQEIASSTDNTNVIGILGTETTDANGVANFTFSYTANNISTKNAYDSYKGFNPSTQLNTLYFDCGPTVGYQTLYNYNVTQKADGKYYVRVADGDLVNAKIWYKDTEYQNIQMVSATADAMNYGFVIWLKKTDNACTVKFDANYTGAAGIASQTVAKNSKVTAPAEPTRTGYDFEGWFTNADHADGETAWNFGTDTVSGDTTLYAHWTAKTYTVTLDSKGGTFADGTFTEGMENKVSVTYGQAYGTLPTPTRDGFTFEGWFATAEHADDDESNKVTAETVYTTAGDTTLYAHWTQNDTPPTGHTVTWDANGGYFGDDTSKTTDVERNVTSVTTGHTAPNRANSTTTRYTFAGWQTKTVNDDGTETYADVTYPFAVTGDVMFYARWNEEAIPSTGPTYTYTLTYNANGGSGAPDAQTEANTTMESHAFTVAGAGSMTNSHKPFKGWATESTATAANYAAGGTITLTKEKTSETLYAVWGTEHEDANGNGFCDVGGECLHTKDTDGCCTVADCNHSTECCRKHEEAPHGTINVHANSWGTDGTGSGNVAFSSTKIEFFVKNKNGGSGHVRASLGTITTDASGNGSLTVNFDNEGYILDANGVRLNKNNTYFKIGDGDLQFDCDPVNAKTDNTGKSNLLGWNFSRDGRIRVFNADKSTNTEAVTLKYDWAVGTWNDAVFTETYWEENKWKTEGFVIDMTVFIDEIVDYSVTFELDGGSASLKNGLTATQTVARGKRVQYPYTADPTHSGGKTFYGWYKVDTDGKLTSEKWEFDSETGYSTKGVNENLTLRARWDNSDITVTFDVNGGDALTTNTQKVTCNEAYGDLPAPTRTGYTFEGWYAKKEHETDETAITKDSTCTETANHTLYAHWTPKPYTVSFDANYEGATDAFTPVGVRYDAAYGTLPTPADRTGYTFEGWFTSQTHAANESPITATSICKTADDHTLYAHWTANSGVHYTIEFWYQNITDNDYTHGDDSNTTGTTGEDIALTAESLGIDPHFTINGEKSTLNGKVKADGSLVLKVYLDRKTYTVAYNLNSGTTTSAQTRFEGCKYGAVTPTIATPVKAADSDYTYTFAGWSPAVADTVSDTVTYTAQWTPVEIPDFKITYMANGGSGTMADTAVDVNGVATVAQNGFKAKSSKWEFSRWNTAADGSGKNYWSGNQLTLTGDLTLYAQWVRDWDDDDSSSTSVKLNTEDHLAYIQGYDDGTFRPTSNITRGAVSAILYRIMDRSDLRRYETDVNSYSDVNEDTWCNVYVSTLEKAGIIVDTPTGGAFRPYDAITRAELVTMLAQFADVTDTETMDFSDVDTDHWAAREISIAAELGWIKGYEDGSFHPDATVTRAALVTMINRALNRVPSKTGNIITKRAITFTDCTPDDWYYIAIQEAANGHEYTRVNAKKDPADEKWTALLKTDVK